MDLLDMGFIALMTVGVVNVVTFFKKDIPSEYKFAISVGVAFALTFVPDSISIVILDKARVALQVAFAASGTYKLATRAGGA